MASTTSFYAQDCQFPYDDSGQPITALDTCHNYSSTLGADYTNPGSDWLLSLRALGITSAGTLTPGTASFQATVNEDCRRWDAYSLSLTLTDSAGQHATVPFTATDRTDQGSISNVDDYCFLIQVTSPCQFAHFSGTTTLPATFTNGAVSASLHITSIDTIAGQSTMLPHIDQTLTWQNMLVFSGGAATPSPSPTPVASTTTATPPSLVPGSIAVEPLTAGISVYVNTPATDDAQGVTGVVWQVFDAAGTLLQQVQGSWKAMVFGGHTSGLEIRGLPASVTSVSVRAAAVNPAGIGPWTPLTLAGDPRADASALSPTTTPKRVVKRTIKCVLGKRVKKVTAKNPKCPAGWRKR